MAKTETAALNAASKKDAYMESITAQIQELDDRIRANNKTLFEEKEKLQAFKRHYQAFLKKQLGDS